MTEPRVQDELTEVLEEAREIGWGDPADYLRDIQRRDLDALAAAVCRTDGEVVGVGDHDRLLALQSVSKAFTYAVALQECGLDRVLDHIGVEPTGEAFNELSQHEDGRPFNPLINAGAIMAQALIPGDSQQDRDALLLDRYSALACAQLEVNEEVLRAEQVRGDRNFALAHMLASSGMLTHDPHEVVQGYLRQCSVEVTTTQLAVMGATFAGGGRNPVTGERIFDERVVQQTLSVMLTCGMYDASGRWVAQVGIPAKSGVSGAMLGVVPGALGLASWSPRLDGHGNSIRGVEIFRRLSDRWDLHVLRHRDPLGHPGEPNEPA
ncbi:glutaminase A [Ornithinimicrobium sp. F0845]|uniref:glutaminase A n=1 Tax=Ornithinimicrobium sp. F0845 TaxID=2926412 RepID=UPI001FF18730|nr:glutaminase A [Ornithinimicrobium sp. F0845]MCK0113195.1 glutaminase A [Ornithinimicrobium sp. F0845]